MRSGAKFGLASFYGSRKFGRMTLDEYLRTHSVTASTLADRIGKSSASLTRIRKGQQALSLELAARIVAATGGKVTLEDLATQEAA